MYKAPVFFVICCLWCTRLYGAIFTVTSNADNGAGTLAEAITQSNANGNSEIDYIYFNLPGTTLASHTITLKQLPPVITSDVVIDGSTQPGPAISVNGAKVIIEGEPPYFNGMLVVPPTGLKIAAGVNSFEMYGLVMRNFYATKGGDFYNQGTAVDCSAAHITIGAKNKGNVFYANGTGLFGGGAFDVKNNLFGLLEDGVSFSDKLSEGMAIAATGASVIGGTDAVDANYEFGSSTISGAVNNGQLMVLHNVFGANMLYQRSADAEKLYTVNELAINITASGNFAGAPDVLIRANTFGCKVNGAASASSLLQLSGNFFGTSADGTKALPIVREAMHFSGDAGRILIGGAGGEGNIFTNAVSSNLGKTRGDGVIEVDNSPNAPIEFSHNSFFCNNEATPYLFLYLKYNEKPLYVSVDNLSAAHADGATKASARVELFYTDKECTGCQPKRYITSVTADATGKWQYNGALEPGYGVMASATLNHLSSEFTDTRFYYDGLLIENVACGNPGSISGLIVYNYKRLEWVDEQNNVVSHDLVLKNVPTGNYRLRAEQFGCMAYTPPISVTDVSAKVNDAQRHIEATVCNGYNGSVTGLKVLNATSYQWLDEKGIVVGTNIDLTNVKAGTYTLMLNNNKCIIPYGPVVVPAAIASNIKITYGPENISPDQCNQQQGSITHISISGGTSPYKYAWSNSYGQIVSTKLDVNNLGAGKYILRVTDASDCGLATATFTIANMINTPPTPLVKDIRVCSYEALVIVTNVQAGLGYRLYQAANDALPIADSKTGKLPVLARESHTYFISSYIGGCESPRTPVNVTFDPHALKVNDAFSPNGDGINDVWDISGLEYYPRAAVLVFARNGQKVYDSKIQGSQFDGKFDGKYLPSGVYYYIITPGSGCEVFSGSLTIIK